MSDYDMVLRFTAADNAQAERLALAWSDTCAAEYGTRLVHLRPAPTPHCDWCGTALIPDFEGNWHDRHGDFTCPAASPDKNDDRHEPALERS